MFDYTSITPDDISRGIDEAVGAATQLLEQIVEPGPALAFDSILLPLDEIGDIVSQANARYGVMAMVHPEEDHRNAALAGQEKLQSFGVELIFREDLYQVVRAYSETPEAADLEGERKRLLEHVMRDFRRSGHELETEKRAALKEKAQRLVELGIKFQSNIDNDGNRLLVDRDDLDGLPEAYVESLETDEQTGSLIVSMAYPHVTPFMENAKRRDLREQLSFLFNTRAVMENTPLLDEAIRLRHESAEILGYKSWAHYVLEERMAESPDRVAAFYDNLIPGLTKKGEAEVAALARLLNEDTGDSILRTWDWRYYDAVQRRTEYGVDQYEVANYLPLDEVLKGMFELCEETFALRFSLVPEAKAWHPDVSLYAIHDAKSDELLAHFYLDLFPREGKFSHAAEFPMIPSRRRSDGTYQNPVCAMVANFTKPNRDTPSLLQHSELETLFHEFGHVLHQNLGRTELGRFSGTNVERDFVEAPSQIMQHWVWRSDILKRFARHYETGATIPDELVDQLVAARQLNKAIFQLRQAQFGLLDAALHDTGAHKDIEALTRRTTEISLMPYHEGTSFAASFGHLMGGYDASYYGYMWAEVFGDDMFSRFEAEGPTNPEVGLDYRRKVLEKGGTVDANDMLVDFLGRQPDNSAFLRKLGVVGTDPGVPVV